MKQIITVQLIVMVECQAAWNDNCSIGQIKKQAKIEAIETACRSLNKDPMIKKIIPGEVTLNATL